MADYEAPNAADYLDVRLDVSTLTLGEAAEAERQSGMTIAEIAHGRASLKLLAMFVHELRTSAAPRNWSELSSLRFLDVSRSVSPSASASASTTPSD